MLRRSRLQAGLTQRELAARAGVPQSTVARIESGVLSPRVETLDRLLEVLGFRIEAGPVHGRGVDRSLIRRMLALSPRQRIAYVTEAGNAIARFRDGATAP